MATHGYTWLHMTTHGLHMGYTWATHGLHMATHGLHVSNGFLVCFTHVRASVFWFYTWLHMATHGYTPPTFSEITSCMACDFPVLGRMGA